MTPGLVRRPGSAIAALLLAGFLGSCVFGSGGLVDLMKLFAERSALGEDAFRLMTKNDELRQKILRLRRSDRALERLARQELGLVRDDEIVYRFRSRDAHSRSGTLLLRRNPPAAPLSPRP